MNSKTLTDLHCRQEVQPLDDAQVDDMLARIHTDWSRTEDGKGIRRDFKFKNYYQTIAFVNALAWIAHNENHHPDLEVSYNHCRVNYSTHSVGGLSSNDFICAARVDALVGHGA